jgi:hypothetical protein
LKQRFHRPSRTLSFLMTILANTPRCVGQDAHQTASPSSPAPCARARAAAVASTAAASTRQVVATTPPTKQHKRLADARAAGANGQTARGRHAPRCAPADARSAGRGSGLAALPQPSQCQPETGPAKSGRDGRRGAAAQHKHYGAVHREAGQPRAMPASSAPPGACSAGSRAPHALSSRFFARFSARFSERQTRANFPPKKNINNNLLIRLSLNQ